MIRTQIQLTDEQARRLKALARQRDISMAQIIREAVDRTLRESSLDEQRRKALAFAGRYADADSDVAVNHDHYLEDAYIDSLR